MRGACPPQEFGRSLANLLIDFAAAHLCKCHRECTGFGIEVRQRPANTIAAVFACKSDGVVIVSAPTLRILEHERIDPVVLWLPVAFPALRQGRSKCFGRC